MIIKQIIKMELHFDNCRECKDYQNIYIKKGYKIICSGSENDWFFICESVENM